MKRTVVEEAMIDHALSRPSTPPPPAPIPVLSFSAVGASVCPVCRKEHEQSCPLFWKAYAEHNKALRASLAAWRDPKTGARLITPIPRAPQCRVCKKPRRAYSFDELCDECEDNART